MKIKKLASIILILSMTAGLCACGKAAEEVPQTETQPKVEEQKAPLTAVERIREKGSLYIEIKDFYGENESVLAKKIAAALGVSTVYTDKDFDLTFGVSPYENPMGMILSDPYIRQRVQILNEEYSPLAGTMDIDCCVALEDTDLNKELLETVNETIAKCLEQGDLPSLDIPEGSIGTVDRSKAYIYENNANLTPVNYDSPKILGFSEDMGTEYQDKLIIACDSPNYWLKLFGLLSGGKETLQLWTGPTGTQTFPYYKGFKLKDPNDGSEKTLIELAECYKPEILVVALGVNGIAKRDEESFSKIYNQMISDLKTASPDTTFVLASIYPVTSTYKRLELINNELITAGNSWILKTCETYDCFYLDIFSVLVGDDGFARPELMQKDGLHPNAEGLSMVLDYIRTHACVTQ